MDDFIDTEPYLLLTGAKNDINSIRSEFGIYQIIV